MTTANEALLQALRDYRQADEDGVMVLVSRQACDEAAAFIERALQSAPRAVPEREDRIETAAKAASKRAYPHTVWEQATESYRNDWRYIAEGALDAAPEAPLPGRSAAPIGDPHWSHCAAIGGPGFHVCRDSDTVMHYIIATGLTLEQATRLADCHNMALDQATPSPAGQQGEAIGALQILRDGYANEVKAYEEQRDRGDLTEMGMAAMWKSKRFLKDLDNLLAALRASAQPTPPNEIAATIILTGRAPVLPIPAEDGAPAPAAMAEALRSLLHWTTRDIETGETGDQLEGLPDSHSFEVVWTSDETGACDFTAGQVRRAREVLAALAHPSAMAEAKGEVMK